MEAESNTAESFFFLRLFLPAVSLWRAAPLSSQKTSMDDTETLLQRYNTVTLLPWGLGHNPEHPEVDSAKPHQSNTALSVIPAPAPRLLPSCCRPPLHRAHKHADAALLKEGARQKGRRRKTVTDKTNTKQEEKLKQIHGPWGLNFEATIAVPRTPFQLKPFPTLTLSFYPSSSIACCFNIRSLARGIWWCEPAASERACVRACAGCSASHPTSSSMDKESAPLY